LEYLGAVPYRRGEPQRFPRDKLTAFRGGSDVGPTDVLHGRAVYGLRDSRSRDDSLEPVGRSPRLPEPPPRSRAGLNYRVYTKGSRFAHWCRGSDAHHALRSASGLLVAGAVMETLFVLSVGSLTVNAVAVSIWALLGTVFTAGTLTGGDVGPRRSVVTPTGRAPH